MADGSNLTQQLDFADMVEEAKLMGYAEPRCANCLFAALVKGMPDHGLCKRQRQDANHLVPIRAHELCEEWSPRWGILRDSPLMKQKVPRKLPVTTGQGGDLGSGW